jgi:hypothetical protein
MADGGLHDKNRRNASLSIEKDLRMLNDALRARSAPEDLEDYPARLFERLYSAERLLQYGFILYCIVTYRMSEGAGSSKCL